MSVDTGSSGDSSFEGGGSRDGTAGPSPHARHPGAAAGRLLVFAAATLWGTSATLARFVFRDHAVPAIEVVELRLVVATLVLAPIMLLRAPDRMRVRREDVPYLVALSVLCVAGLQGSYYYAISRLGVGLAIVIQYLAPSLIVLWGLARGERVTWRTGGAVVAAVAGTALLVGDLSAAAARGQPLDWIVAFASAGLFAGYIVASKRGLARYAPETMLLWTFSIAAVFWMIVTPPWTIVARGYGADLWGMFLLLGLFSTLVPFYLFNRGLGRLGATEAGILATLEPLVAVVAAWAFLGEGLRPIQWAGAVLVLAASALASARTPEALPAQAERG
jgi:drug/metabolite transporter (DMT)-like permease